VYIEDVNYVDNSVSPALEIDLGMLLTEQEYQAIPVKSLTGSRPAAAYWNPTFPLGTLIPWPIPTDANLLWAIYYAEAVEEFATINDLVALPPGYRRMLTTNLAVELLDDYSRQAPPLLVRAAADSKAVVKRSNERLRLLQFSPEALPGASWGFSIRTG
jgi:hypothetical protein